MAKTIFKKNWKVAMLAVLTVGCFTAAGATYKGNSVSASAATISENPLGVSYALVESSVRVSEPLGLRFEAQMTAEDYAKVATYEAENGVDVTFGMAIMPASYISKYSADLTEESMFGETPTYDWSGEEDKTQILHKSVSELTAFPYESETVEYYALRCVITGIEKTENYWVDFYAKPYMAITGADGTEYYFGGDSDYDTANVATVAESNYIEMLADDNADQNVMSALRGILDTAYGLKGQTPIYTADEAYTALSVTDTTKNYVLTRDVDLSEKDFTTTIDQYKNSIDGNGYALTGITADTTYIIKSFYGTLKNISIYATAIQKDGAYSTSNYYLIYNMCNGALLQDVYVSLSMDLTNAVKAEAHTYMFYQAADSAGGTGNFENVIMDVSYNNASASVTNYRPRVLGHWEKTAVNMTNVYVIGSSTSRLVNERYNVKATLTIQNGNDAPLVSDETTTSDMGTQYCYANMNTFYRTDYIYTFTADMWKDIIKVDSNYGSTYFAGYTAISTAQELATALVSSARTKYYLTKDIDMTGVSLTSNGAQFGGLLDGDGHKVTGISYTSKSFIGYVENSTSNGIDVNFRNIAFYVTKVIAAGTTGAVEFGFINVMQSNALENVYIDLTINANGENVSITGGIFNQTNNGAKISLTNVVGNLRFVNCENATVGDIGLLYILSGGATQVTMTNAYLAGIEYKENVSASAYLVRLFSTTSNTSEHYYSITNGADDTIKEVKTTVSSYVAPSVLTAKQYCYTSLTEFKASEYKAYITGGCHLWYNVFNVWNA